MPEEAPDSKIYAFSKQYQSSVFFTMLLLLALAAVTIYVGIINRHTPNPNAPMLIALALTFIMGSFYCFDILPRLHSQIIVSGEAITQRFRDGHSVQIRWQDVARIRGRRWLGRVEITSRDARKVIHVEAQIEGFEEIITALQKKLRLGA